MLQGSLSPSQVQKQAPSHFTQPYLPVAFKTTVKTTTKTFVILSTLVHINSFSSAQGIASKEA